MWLLDRLVKIKEFYIVSDYQLEWKVRENV